MRSGIATRANESPVVDTACPSQRRRKLRSPRCMRRNVDGIEYRILTVGSVIQAKSLFDLTGKVALVTGASRGLGQTFARALASAGADLVVTSRKKEDCEPV